MLRSCCRMLSVLVMLTVGGAAACASYAVIPEEGRARLNEAHEGELLYVKQSLYAGRFYDDDRYRLLHARKFEELTYLLDAEGQPIPPPPANEIIPAGTRVRVERIEWPDGDAVFRRPLYTPRYTTWIFLRVARGRGDETTFERAEKHIMLLPGGISDEATFNEWFEAALTRTDPNPWLRTLPEVQRVAIDLKRVEVGMTYEALTAAMGFPDSIGRNGDGSEAAFYGSTVVTLRDGVVSDSRVLVRDVPLSTTTTTPAATTPPETETATPPLDTNTAPEG